MTFFNNLPFHNKGEQKIKPYQELIHHSSDLVQHLEQVIFSISYAGHWTFLNDAWVTLTGFSIQDSIEKNVLEFVHPDDRNLCSHSFISLVNNEQDSIHIKTRFISKDDNYFWASIYAKNFMGDQPAIIGSFSDISNEVYTDELSQSNHLSLSSLVDNLSGLIYRGRNDHAWSMEYISAGCYELTGYKAEELINKSITFASLIHSDDQVKVWEEVQLALNNRIPFEIIYRIKTITGEIKWILERGQGNFSSSNGDLLSLQGHMIDITNQKEYYLRALNDNLYVGISEVVRSHLLIDRLKLAVTRSRFVSNFNYALLLIQADRLDKVMSGFSENEREVIRSQIIKLLSEITQPLDTLCIINDDKFAILSENIESINNISNLTQRIHDKLSCPIIVKGSNLFITVSIGIVTNSPHYDNHNHIIRDANTALIRAKVIGGGCHEIFDERLNSKISVLNRIDADISNAIKQNNITILYQPIISAKDDIIAGLEASLVWDHPRKGQVILKSHLPTDIEKRLADKLNQHLLNLLCEQIINWKSRALSASPLYLIIDFFDTPNLKKTFFEQLEELLFKKTESNITYYLLLTDEESRTLPKEQSTLLQQYCSINNISICIEFHELGKFISNNIKRTDSDMIILKNPVKPDNSEQYTTFKSMIEFIHTQNIPVVISRIDTDVRIHSIRELNADYLQGSNFLKPVDLQTINSILSKPKWPWLEIDSDL